MASVRSLSDSVRIGAVSTRNRICIPPMVYYNHVGEDGMVGSAHVQHYLDLARGGAGLIIQEATCVSPTGRLRMDQPGIWSDDHIPGLRAIVEAVHGAGCPIFVQLHHAGLVSAGAEHLCPSAYEKNGVTGQEMTLEDIRQVKADFLAAGIRAKAAGYDGIELHGCHSYLLCQFLNGHVNRRTDRYGDGLVLVEEIYHDLREALGPDFVLGIRLGAFEPTLREGIAHAKALEQLGLDFLDISYGFFGEMDLTAPGKPGFSAAVRGADAIAKAVSIPVFAVDGIRTPQDAEAVLRETDAAMVDVGRSALVDPQWPEKCLRGETPGKCLSCQDCQWRIDENRCPGRKLLAREK